MVKIEFEIRTEETSLHEEGSLVTLPYRDGLYMDIFAAAQRGHRYAIVRPKRFIR